MSARILAVTALGAAGVIALAVALPGPARRGAEPPANAPDEQPGEQPEDPAPEVEPVPEGPPPLQPGWWVGDLHVHVSPPDTTGHSALTVERAIDAARRARLDFLALTPHEPTNAPLGEDAATAPAAAESSQVFVERRAAAHLVRLPDDLGLEPAAAPRRPILVVAGWEYTRESPGHLGLHFVDVAAAAAAEDPAAQALADGGLVVVNHPFFRPVASDLPVMRSVSGDRSWRPFVGDGERTRTWNAIEVWHDRSVWVEKLHASAAERSPETQMIRAALAVWDAETVATRRRITAVGGSDAHGRLPYTVAPMRLVSVHVETPDQDGLRDALLAARVTFGRDGGPSARDFTARGDVDDDEVGIGASLRVRESVRLRWSGTAMLIENGVRLGDFDGGTTRTLSEPGAFAFWRIEKPGDAFSNMIYANLDE